MAECIHGFDEGMCDICFPRAAAVAPAAEVRAPRRTTRPTPSGPARRGPAAPAGTGQRVPPFSARRLYHWTPLTNLESILLDGEVRAAAGLVPDVDVASPLVRELRAHADVGDGRRVDAFVPFAASPDAERWVELRSGAEQPHWSAAARALTPADYAVLVVTGREAGSDVVVADGDAAAAATRFAVGEPGRALAQAARTDPELTAPEVLVAGPVPVSRIDLVAVANEPARARVRSMYADVEGAPPRVVVHPPWFAGV